MYKDIDLTNPKLGEELLNDARGDLPWMSGWRIFGSTATNGSLCLRGV